MREYQKYVSATLILFSLYPLIKIGIDLHSLWQTGRVIGTEDIIKSLAEKKEQKAINTNVKRRILIVSGSNSFFGLSAAEISKKTGFPAINLALTAELGIEYLLYRAQQIVRSGDIAVLPLEYDFYLSEGSASLIKTRPLLRNYLYSYDQFYLTQIPVPDLLISLVIKTFEWPTNEHLRYLQGQLTRSQIHRAMKTWDNQVSNDCYKAVAMNDHGDLVCNQAEPRLSDIQKKEVRQAAMNPSSKPLDPGGYIQSFIAFAKNNNVAIVPAYPVSSYTQNYSQSSFKEHALRIKQFWQTNGIHFHDSLGQSLLPPNLMYNTNYHPNDLGKARRTANVIPLIRSCIRKSELYGQTRTKTLE